MSVWVPANEIPEGGGRCYDVQGMHIAVIHMKGRYYALKGCCPHAQEGCQRAALHEVLETCPNRGWLFDLSEGACNFRPGQVQELRTVTTQARWWEGAADETEVELPPP